MTFSHHIRSVPFGSCVRPVASRGGSARCKWLGNRTPRLNLRPRPVAMSSSPAEYISVAEQKVEADDMLGALRQFELALSSDDLPIDLQRKLLYNTCAIHAGFGDLELAQVCVRHFPFNLNPFLLRTASIGTQASVRCSCSLLQHHTAQLSTAKPLICLHACSHCQ